MGLIGTLRCKKFSARALPGEAGAGALKQYMTEEAVRTDYSHFVKGRRERPPKAGIAAASLKSTGGSIFSSNA